MTTGRAWTLTAAGALLWVGAMTSRLLGAGTVAGGARRGAAPVVGDRALRGRGDAHRGRAQPAVHAAVSAVERRRRQAPLGASARGRRHRHDAPRSLGASPSGRASGKSSSSTAARSRRAFCGRARRTTGNSRRMPGTPTSAMPCWRRPRAWPAWPKWRRANGTACLSREECRACHDSGRTEILGFTALQLSDDRDALAPHAEPLTGDMVTLAHARRRATVATGAPRLGDDTAADRHADAQERAVLGYLSTNCGSCHNRQSTMASLGLFLKYTLDVTTRARPMRSPRPWGSPDTGSCRPRLTARRESCSPGRPELERVAAARQVAPAVESDAAARHRRGRSRGAGAASRRGFRLAEARRLRVRRASHALRGLTPSARISCHRGLTLGTAFVPTQSAPVKDQKGPVKPVDSSSACDASSDRGCQPGASRPRYQRRPSAARCATGTTRPGARPGDRSHGATSSSDRKSRMVDQVKPMSSHHCAAGTPT